MKRSTEKKVKYINLCQSTSHPVSKVKVKHHLKSAKNTDKAVFTEPTPVPYRTLQNRCSALGLKAVGKRAVLEDRLRRYETHTTTDADYPKTKQHKHGKIAYRNAQKVIKYFCDNLPGFHASHKRSGWDNLLAIAIELDDANAIERTCNTEGTEHKQMVVFLGLLIDEATR